MKIQGKTLDKSDVGRSVRYIPNHAHGDLSHSDVEDGWITSWNEVNVFVNYGRCSHPATSPTDLVWGNEMNTSSFRLSASIEALRQIIRGYESPSTEEKLTICIEVCELFFRFADVVERILESDRETAEDCVAILKETVELLNSPEGDEEIRYLKSVQKKHEMVRLVVDEGMSIDDVLRDTQAN